MSFDRAVDVQAAGAPTKLAYNALRFIGSDWLVVVGCIAVMTTVTNLATPVIGMLFGIPGIYILWPLNNARRYFVWLMAIYGRVWIDWVRQGVLWEASPDQDAEGKEGVRKQPVKRWRRILMRIFVEPKVFMAQVDELYDYGVQYSSRFSTDTIAIKVEGWNFAGKAADTQSDLLDELAKDIKSLAYYKGLKPRVSFLTRSRYQDDSDQLVEQYTHSLPEVFNPLAFPDSAYSQMQQRGMEVSDESAVKLFEEGVISRDQVVDFRTYMIQRGEVLEAVRTYDRKYETYVMLTIPQSARLKSARRRNVKRRKPIKRSELEKQDIVRLAERFRRSLAAVGMENPHILSKQEYEDFRREARDIDPESITEYREWRLDHPDEDRSQAEKSITTDGRTVCFDGTSYHLTLRLTNLPEAFLPDTSQELMEYLPPEIRSYVTRSTVSEVVRGTKEYVRTTAFFNLISSIMTSLGPERFGPKGDMPESKLRNIQEKIARDDNVNWFSIYIGLAHTDPEVIENDVLLVEEAVQRMRGECEVITGSAWTLKAADSVNLGIAAM